MKKTLITLQRAKVNQRANIPMQIENMSYQVASDLGGQNPYDSYWIYTTGGGSLDVRRSDLLIDQYETDPLTSAATQYRVFGNPEQYFSVYARIPAEKVLGT